MRQSHNLSKGKVNELDNFRDQKVCILGLGYVGLTLAVAMADIGFKILGVEIRDEIVELLSKGKAHFFEPALEERLQRVIRANQLEIVKNIPESWDGSVFIITVGTPLSAEGEVRLDMVENVAREVAQNIKEGDLVIMRSTVKLGTTRTVVTPALSAAGVGFELAFCPERTLEGNALSELRQLPQIVGGVTTTAAVRASQLFQFITPTVVRVSDVETAEMIKLIDNAQRDVQFAYANEVARACDAIGVSALEVIQAGKLGYPRTNLPMPGPVGGPCLEKDSHILAEGLAEFGIKPEITIAARKLNERQPLEVVSYLHEYTSSQADFAVRPRIALLGLAFKGKPETDDLRGTMAKPIFDQLAIHFPDAEFVGYDAVLSEKGIVEFGLKPVSSIEEAFRQSNLVLIMNNHPVFSKLALEELSTYMENPGLIYDFWNFYKSSDLHLSKGINYVALGSHGKSPQ